MYPLIWSPIESVLRATDYASGFLVPIFPPRSPPSFLTRVRRGATSLSISSTQRAALTPPALEHPQRASVFAQFPAHCVSRVANPPYRLRQALLRDAELVSPVLYFVGLQEADAGPVRRSSLAGIVCHVCRAPFVGATATSSVRSACTEQRPGIEAQRQAVATYLNGATGASLPSSRKSRTASVLTAQRWTRHWRRRACVRYRSNAWRGKRVGRSAGQPQRQFQAWGLDDAQGRASTNSGDQGAAPSDGARNKVGRSFRAMGTLHATARRRSSAWHVRAISTHEMRSP